MTRDNIPHAPATGRLGSHGTGSVNKSADHLTGVAGVTLLLINLLHAAVFAVHSWWGDWLAGPARQHGLTTDALVQFWGSLGGFVVPGVLLALLILTAARRGRPAPAYVGVVLAIWAIACTWVIGPGGFLLFLIPAVSIIAAAVLSARRADLPRAGGSEQSKGRGRDASN